MPIAVSERSVREHARGLLEASQVTRRDLALAFAESRASSVEVHVEGRNFYPPMLADIAAASSSVHVNQFGFRPGDIGDAFADALVAKAAEGVSVQARRRPPGLEARARIPERSTSGSLPPASRSASSGQRSRARRPGRSGLGRGDALEPRRGLGHIDHRKFVIVDGRIGWIGGAGIEDHFQDGRFHDLFIRVAGPVVGQLQLVFLAGFRWLGGSVPAADIETLFPQVEAGAGSVPAVVLHNAPGRYRPITDAIARLLDSANETLDVVNPYVTDRRMIRRIGDAARRGVRVRLFVPANANNWACAAAQRFHHAGLLDAGVRILEYPTMLHAKAFVRDGEEVLAGTCNLEAWSLKRFFEIDLQVWSKAFAAQFDERFCADAENVSSPGRPLDGVGERAKATAFAAISPLL